VSAGGDLALAESIARATGALLRERFESGEARAVSSKSTDTDLVSQADLDAEALIRERLAAERPDDAILGEEGGAAAGVSGRRWVVDPLDGTVNFLFGIPQWAVSVAVQDAAGAGIAGVVFDPMRDELWAAAANGPATLNGRELRGSDCDDLAMAMVATGFGYDAGVRASQVAVVSGLLPLVRDIRRFGSAALDLVWTAAGRYDAYFERGVQPWDVAAGGLIAERAGLQRRRLDPMPPAAEGILVAPAAIVDQLYALVTP
jgi:myo-inositol-1(or 4)-monophosphatase